MSHKLRFSFALLICVLLSVGVCAQSGGTEIDFALPGFSKTKPDSEYFVEINGGFMVPYTEKIPGTDTVFEMMPIPGGTFLMGSEKTNRYRKDETPQVQITIEPFWMGKTEVTWEEYRRYMKLERAFKKFQKARVRLITEESKIDAVSTPSALYDPAYTFDAGEGDRQACATQTQFAAKQYTKFLSLMTETFYRLPTEAEWEYACRAGTKTLYSFGDDENQLEEYAWFYDNSDERRHEVARLKPNPWGLHDMHGNVCEWVLDQYVENHYQKLDFETVTAELAFAKPTEVYPRVVRGGGYDSNADDCRSAARRFSNKDWKDNDPGFPQSPWWHTSYEAAEVGFRVMRPLHTPSERNDKESFWKSDHEIITDAVRAHILDSGRGAFGIVDPELYSTIEEFRRKK